MKTFIITRSLPLFLISFFLGACASAPSTSVEPAVVQEVQPILATVQRLLQREVVSVKTGQPVQIASEHEILEDFAALKSAVEVTLPEADPLQGICLRRINQLNKDRALQIGGTTERNHSADVQAYQDLQAVNSAIARAQGILAPAPSAPTPAPQVQQSAPPVAEAAPTPATEQVQQGGGQAVQAVEAMEAPKPPVAEAKPTSDLPPVKPRK